MVQPTNYLYTELRTEHARLLQLARTIQQSLEQRSAQTTCEQLSAFLNTCDNHFQKENDQLFAKVYYNKRLQSGGPFCTYFFGLFIECRPLVRVEKQMAKIRVGFVMPKPSDSDAKYLVSETALAIPAEDHFAIKVLISGVTEYLQSISQPDWNWVESSVNLLLELLDANHAKEEQCLFPHIEQLVNF